MNELRTRIEQLPRMRVARVQVVSDTPEQDAWMRLRAWAAPRGLLEDRPAHPVFGFNNPPPSLGRPEHGYECWIRVDEDVPDEAASAGVTLRRFEGGLYLVTTCRLTGDPAGEIRTAWRRLWQMTQGGPYRWRETHELERPHDPDAPARDMVLDLYLPICRSESSIPEPAGGKAT